jgi:hypothetical protein
MRGVVYKFEEKMIAHIGMLGHFWMNIRLMSKKKLNNFFMKSKTKLLNGIYKVF